MANMLIACPHCGRRNECHDPAAGTAAVPRDGSISICWGCRKVSVFKLGPHGFGQRRPNPAELEKIMSDEGVRQVIAAIAESFTPAQALALSPYGREP